MDERREQLDGKVSRISRSKTVYTELDFGLEERTQGMNEDGRLIKMLGDVESSSIEYLNLRTDLKSKDSCYRRVVTSRKIWRTGSSVDG